MASALPFPSSPQLVIPSVVEGSLDFARDDNAGCKVVFTLRSHRRVLSDVSLAAKLPNRFRVIFGVKDRCPGNQHISAVVNRDARGFGIDAAIDFDV